MLSYLGPLFLTFKLALITTIVLIFIGTPVAWWLANTRLKIKPAIEAVIALPIVLPPTVMGFYLLIFLGPNGGLGAFWVELTGQPLTFSFLGLVIASVIYSFPFVVQPLQGAFETVGKDLMEAAHTLGAKPTDAFFSVAVPMAKRGYLTAFILGFAHTLGEFGVVLMIGGNIPGETRLVSIAIYDHVESLEYTEAHILSLILIGFAFVSMLMMFFYNYKSGKQ